LGGAALAVPVGVGVGLVLVGVGEGLTEDVPGGDTVSAGLGAGTQPAAAKATRPVSRPILVLVLRAVFVMTDLPQ
jgi:hypothetical protein